MTKQQILEKALLKAHKNGWEPLETIPWKNVEITQWHGNGMVGIALLYSDGDTSITWMRELEGIIYNHDFAKALWGEEKEYTNEIDGYIEEWKYRLMRMVITDDPIKYLGDNL